MRRTNFVVRSIQSNRLRRFLLAAAVAAASLQVMASWAQNAPSDASAAGFQEFGDRVEKYVQLHKSVESKLPKLKSTNEPELLEA
ncbi:MAG: hypothetical protein ABLQ96_07450, partial [Candidatus Acidiferrum sp.]